MELFKYTLLIVVDDVRRVKCAASLAEQQVRQWSILVESGTSPEPMDNWPKTDKLDAAVIAMFADRIRPPRQQQMDRNSRLM